MFMFWFQTIVLTMKEKLKTKLGYFPLTLYLAVMLQTHQSSCNILQNNCKQPVTINIKNTLADVIII